MRCHLGVDGRQGGKSGGKRRQNSSCDGSGGAAVAVAVAVAVAMGAAAMA